MLQCKRLLLTGAYMFAVHNKLENIPESWEKNEMAGIEWMNQFRSRHPSLSLRKPEGCSLSRATAFNKTNVSEFFDNLEKVFTECPELTDPTRIYNLDETALTTVQTPSKVMAGKETRRLSKAVSAERGTLVTGCNIVAANGIHLPPVLIFPRKNFKCHMLNGAPSGTLGLATPSGWMTSSLFEDVMRHFVKYSHSSIQNRTLLIFDNHESHLSPFAINYARDNGVTIVTIPPHCSGRLQPLDVSVHKPLKNAYNQEMDAWMLQHPGRTVTIYEIAGLFGSAFIRAMTPRNIMSGFSASGIWPFNRNIFTDLDFMSSSVTDRPSPITPAESMTEPANPAQTTSSISSNDSPAGTADFTPPLQENSFDSPTTVFGIPKAEARKKVNAKRIRKTVIATSTPEKSKIEERHAEKSKKKPKASVGKAGKRLPVMRKLCVKSDSSSEDDPLPLVSDTSDSETFSDLEEPQEFQPTLTFTKNDFVVVKFTMDQTKDIKHYVGKIIEIDEHNAAKISFLRRAGGENRFVYPQIPDVAWIHQKDIVSKVEALSTGTTSRQKNFFTFSVNLADTFCNMW